MKHLRMKSVAASVLALALSTSASFAADITMNVGFGAPEASIYGRFGKIFERLAEEYTGGTVDVKLRCCNQIATEDEGFKAMQLGTVDGFFITANNIDRLCQDNNLFQKSRYLVGSFHDLIEVTAG